MKTIPDAGYCSHLDSWVASFEAAWQASGDALLSEHLPPRDHPLFERVLGELVCVDLERQWEAGRRKRLEAYRADFPELFANSRLLEQAAREEYRQRSRAGEVVDRAEYEQCLGIEIADWPIYEAAGNTSLSPKTRVLDAAELDKANRRLGDPNAEVSQSAPKTAERVRRARAKMPKVGETIFGFELVDKLGKGSFGTVFLAKQTELDDRLVAIKFSPILDNEPRHLARMQHTNIVPIYSVHHSDAIQAVCMPYLGSATLDRLLKSASREGKVPESGQALLNTLYVQRSTVASHRDSNFVVSLGSSDSQRLNPQISPILERLAHTDYVETVLWMVARLTDGLEHAHERGILHLDLKPANILVTDDGQPMLLDFNLSIDSSAEAPERARLGGTLPYMSPEQIESVMHRSRRVDARSDLYSLGVIMFEMLSGQRPFKDQKGSILEVLPLMLKERRQSGLKLRQLNRHVPRAVDNIVCKLLSANPAERYQKAADLRDDLERHLAHLPLRHAPDRSFRERFGKWRRRRPRFSTACLVGLAALVILVLPTTAIAIRQNQVAKRQMQIELAEAKQTDQEMERESRAVQVLLATETGDRVLLQRGIERGKSVLETYHIRGDSDWLSQPLIARLPEDQQARLRLELGEMLLLMARGEHLRAGDFADEAAARAKLHTALQWNQLAEKCYPAGTQPKLLASQRAELLKAMPEETGRVEMPPASSESAEYDLYHEGVASAMAGRYRDGLESLRNFTENHPQHFAAWFVRGRCLEMLGQNAASVDCWDVCIALEPDMPLAYFNRAAVRLQLADFRGADADLTKALRLQPDWPAALINRAIARKNLKQYASAIADLDQLPGLADAPSRAWFLRAEVKKLAGDGDGANRDQAEGMKREPNDELGWSTRGYARMNQEPAAALQDFDAALQLNPRSREALINKSVVYSEMLKRPKDAVAVLDRFLEYYPDHFLARAGRGVVLARIGECKRARADAEECLRQDRSTFIQYQIAGLYAQLTRHEKSSDAKEQALLLLGAALRSGFSDLDTWKSDHDLDPIRGEAEFKRLQDVLAGLTVSRGK